MKMGANVVHEEIFIRCNDNIARCYDIPKDVINECTPFLTFTNI
jgi:hypothetical protein